MWRPLTVKAITVQLVVLLASASACAPRARIPPRPLAIPAALPPEDTGAVLARQLAPVLYLQRDEKFPLVRAVAVLHPTRRVIAYHLLWRDDVQGGWLPFTSPTDQEIIWVGYDSTNAPTDIWTYWHGRILHTPWRGQVAADVQWGKHGSLPHGVVESSLPVFQRLADFYLLTWLLIPDYWLGNLSRPGPWCFCHGYRRYRDFSRPILLAPRLDAIVRAADPDPVLRRVFGLPYSRKTPWPWGYTPDPPR